MDARTTMRRLMARQFKLACGGQGPKRLSLTHPRFNLREIAKQMVLLEDHLAHPYKHCPDCIRKHLMTIEAYAEEAVSLDQVGIYRDLAGGLAEQAREWMESVVDGVDLPTLGQAVRAVRKNLVPLVHEPRDMPMRLASRFASSMTPCVHLWMRWAKVTDPNRTAVLILGDVKHLQDSRTEKFYVAIGEYLWDRGFSVQYDAGLPFTEPVVEARLWVAHSRGVDRLRFAPEDAVKVMFGSSEPGAVNHPQDTLDPTSDYHFVFTNEMKDALDRAIETIRSSSMGES